MKNIFLSLFLFTSIIVAQQSLQIMVVSPTGTVNSLDQVEAIAVTFSEPMVALQAVSNNQTSGFIEISPKVSGVFRWQGTSTLTFIPSKRLEYSTAYTVTIPAGIKSVSGKKLSEQFEWRFVTPVPTVISTSPYTNQQYVEVDHSIMIEFNQRIIPTEIAKFISVEVRADGKSSFPKFLTLWKGKKDTNQVHIKTEQPFPLQSTVVVRVKPGAKGVEGNLSMTNEFSFQFQTANRLSFVGIMNGQFVTPGQPLRMRFSNPVFEQDLLDHLRLIPAVSIADREYYSNYASNEWYVNLELEPEKTYQGFILPGFKDQFGQTITDTITFEFTTDQFWPYYSMPTGIGLLEAYAKRRIPITTVNIDKFEVKMGKVDPENIIGLRKQFQEYGELTTVQNGKVTPTFESYRNNSIFTFTNSVVPSTKRNSIGYYYAGLDTVLGKTKLGTVLLFSSERNSFYQTLVNVSNMGVTAKFSPDDILVWVTKLNNAGPVANAEVEIRNDDNAILWKGKSTKDGTVKAPGWGKLGIYTERISDVYDDEEYYDVRKPMLWIFVKEGNDFTYISSHDGSGIDPWSFDINYEWRPAFERVQGNIFTDRGLYKAGEKVEVKGVIRSLKEGSWKIIKGDSVRLTVRNSRNEEIFTKTMQLSSYSTADATVELSANAPLGYYSMTLELKEVRSGIGHWMNIAYQNFRVEAFRPAEFDVTTMLHKKSFIVGDSISGIISAKYLFGAPLKNADVRWRLTINGGSYEPPGFDGYYFSTLYWLSRYDQSHYRELENADATLDDFGNLQIRSHLKVGEIHTTSMLMLEADATSSNRQVISGRTSVVVHPGEFYLGIGQQSSFVKSDSSMKFKLIAVTPEGKFVPNIAMKFKIFNRIWRSVRRAEVGGRYYWDSKVENVLVDSGNIISSLQAIEHRYVPKDPGFYFTELSGTDSRGNTVSSNSYFYVSGSGYVPWERTNDDRIELITDKTNYKPGDVASIIIKNPYESADALISIEREGVLQHFTTKVKGSAPQIDIPIRNDFLPNVYVSVVLLQGRVDSIAATKDSDIGRPSFKIGYAKLSVSPLEKKLGVKIETSKKDYRPGDSVEVQIMTQLSNGKPVPAEVTLSVADLGVLNLTGYRLPELFDEFYRQRGLAVSTTESRAHLIEQRNFGEKAEEIGGGGAEKMASQVDADGIRKDFRPSAYWNPRIITDAKGKAVLKFKLPDNITAFQLMAAAHTLESEFGYGENTITVSKPLLLQPSFPRFARVGDVFEGGVVALNYSEKEKSVKIIASVEGIVSESKDTMMYLLKPGESKEIRLKLRAEKIGTAKFIFRAYTDDDYDGMQWTIPIQIPRVRETVASSSSLTENSVQEKITRPADVFEELGSFDVSVSSTQLVGLQNSVQYLFEYPYGCLEQKMSRALPIIIGGDMVKSFNLEILKGKDHRRVVQDVLDEVPQFQQSNGGFTYWKNSYDSEPYPYLSSYAMLGLTMAMQNNYRVDKSSFDQGMNYIRGVLTGSIPVRYSWDVDAGTKSLILYVLALNGKPDFGYMERLYSDRAKLPLVAKAYLLRALKRSNGNSSMITTLASEFMNSVKLSPTTAHFEERNGNDWWWMFHSNVKTTAVIMQALVETQPTNEIIPKVVRWLLDQKRNGIWRTTQENLYVIDALTTYFSVYEKDEPHFTAEISLAGKQILKETFDGRTLKTRLASTPIAMMPIETAPLDVTRTGVGRMYYTMRMYYYPKDMSQVKEEGFSISKSVEHLVKGEGGIQRIGIGNIARVTLVLTTKQDRSFVVVDDPLPAGFEVINTSFQTTGRNLDENDRQSWYFNHKERKDDRVMFFSDYLPAGVHTLTYLVRVTSYGTFQMPATRIEQMYEPEVFGQTSSGVVTVQ